MSLLNLFRKKQKTICFTTPSHSQKFFITSKFEQFYKFDISETDTHNPQKALFNAEEKASDIYGTKQTLFLTNGSTSGIITAVLASAKKGDKVLICENAHPSHKNAVDLAGGVPIYYALENDLNWGIQKPLTADELQNILDKNQDIKAVIITTPSYEGVVSDIKNIKSVCEKYGCFLIADEAHGALYPFSEKLPGSAVKHADFTIQSLHKTAGGLNPTALIHTNTDIDMRKFLSKINTTSPSYPLLLTIEKNINFLNSKKGRKKLDNLIINIENLKLNCKNIKFYNGDITKILIKHEKYSGFELSDKLYNYDIEDEITNEKSTMLLCGIGTSEKSLKRLEKVLNKL